MSTSARLAEIAKQIGREHHITFDLETVVLRATGPTRWDVYGTGEVDGRLYGTITAVDPDPDSGEVEYRFTLRDHTPRGGTDTNLYEAVHTLVSDWPNDTDPAEQADVAIRALDTLAEILTDRNTAWSGDYALALAKLGQLSRRMTAVFDHIHGQAMVIAAERDSTAWGRMAELTADAAHECTLVTMVAESAAGAAGSAQANTPAEVAQYLVNTYGAARNVEACAGRTAAERGAGR